MKKAILLFAIAIGASVTVSAQKMEFETVDINYGEIAKGSEPNREFVFTNTGTAPLIITKSQGSCGCTIPTTPTEPIMPGAKGRIPVRYDTQRVGQFTKNVTLTTNAPGQETFVLTIHGTVKAEDAAVPANDSKSTLIQPH